ncbi:AGE family epimerase/isomerase [candidate division KSB1 bacterium]|nr:AGE family epimerase/isomerase [candidate division KSB1 bacterium]
MEGTHKYSFPQTRMVYAFAEGFRLFQDARFKKAAQQGFDFYTRYFWDEKFNGWYHALNRSGQVHWDTSKRSYNFAFVIYCFAQYYGATGDPRAIEVVEDTIFFLDQKLADRKAGGWHESFNREWSILTTPGKTYNVCMHLLEAMLAGYENIDQRQFLPRIEAALDLIKRRALNSAELLPFELFDADWAPTLQAGAPVINYGHIMETAFFFLQLAEMFTASELKQQALEFIEFAMKFGFQPGVGMACFGDPEDHHDQRFFYWSQTETIAALARAYRITRDARYWNWLQTMLEIVFTKFADFQNGEWITRVDPDGTPGDLVKGSSHKACYHITQALSGTIRELSQL